MATPIKTTHVGSLPREQDVVDFIFAREKNEPYDPDKFWEIMANHVDATVKKQVDAGIDYVSDGETSKISYATYIKDRYHGFDGDNKRTPPQDLVKFPSFLQRLANAGGTPTYARPSCVSDISKRDVPDLQNDITNLNNACKKHGAYAGFMNAASPGVISLFLPNAFYETRDIYLEKLADNLQEEYETIVNNGLLLQLDCPDLALSRHMLFHDLSDAEFIKIAARHIEVLNHALRNIPNDKIRLHICWGNYEGPHICDIAMEDIFDTLMSVKASYILFETSNPRHGHEWQVFADNKNAIPDDKVLIPGVVDTTTNFVEHPRLIAERIQRFVNIAGRERVIAGTDCGFGTFAGYGTVDGDIAYAKLRSLAEGAALV